MNKQRSNRIAWLDFLAGSILAALVLCLLASTGSKAAVPASLAITPTPTPVPSRRDYDPPAPSNLILPVKIQKVKVVAVGGHPRIVKLWGGYDDRVGIDFYAQYDVIVSQGFTDQQLLYLRAQNANMIVLYSGTGTYDTDTGPLGSRWIAATEGSPEFECFYRGTDGEVLRVDFWGHGMFNMGDDWCADQIVDYLVSQIGSRMYTVFDGVFFDRVTQAITPILTGIDLDHNGLVDDESLVNEKYWRGTERFLDRVRQELGDGVITVANDAPLVYTSRLNGREYESFIRSILGGNSSWTAFRYNYEQWMQAAREPRLTMVMGNPPLWMEQKYGLSPYYKMKAALVDEAAAYYRQMRFGLTSALMEGGLYSYEFGTTWHGNAWWYDEFDGAGLGKGYLGAPLGQATYTLGSLTTMNTVQNPGFEEPGPVTWTLRTAAGAQATLTRVSVTTTYATTGTHVARLAVAASSRSQDVRLEQGDVSLVNDRVYTLSFWGKATRQLWDITASLHASVDPGIHYGLADTVKLGTAWQRYWMPFTATATVDNAVLAFDLGLYTGTVWMDEVSLQEGRLPTVFRRDFEHGIALCNATMGPQTVSLGGTYRKIPGTQAPLFKTIVDDTDPSSATFIKIGGWAGIQAGYDEWRDTYHYAVTTTNPDGVISKVIWRPDIPRAGHYTVYAWIAPHTGCDDMVTYSVRHAAGTTPVTLDPRVSEPAWVALGTFAFDAGTGGDVTLSNLTRSTLVVADAIKFESTARYNSGAHVTSVTLQGQDGMILLHELPIKIYMPVIRLGGM